MFCHAFIFLLKFLICYYPWSLDLIKWSRNKINKQDNEDVGIQVSLSYFLVYFPDILIAFETYCLWRLRWISWYEWWRHRCAQALDSGCNFIVYYFTYLPFFSVLFELKYAPCRCPASLPDLLQSHLINFHFYLL